MLVAPHSKAGAGRPRRLRDSIPLPRSRPFVSRIATSLRSRTKNETFVAAAVAASFSRLAAGRPLSVVVKATSSRMTGGATTVSVCLPDAPKPTTCGEKPAASTPRLGQRASAGGETLAKKVRVSLKFDVALLARVSESAKRQGITRISWLHRAAFVALGGSRIDGA
jgi:hypothetical protein